MDSPIMTDEDASPMADESRPTFYIGHHDSKRTDFTPQLLRQVQDCGVRLPPQATKATY